MGRGAGRGRGRGAPLPGSAPPKARAPRANPTLATLIAQLSQVFEGQRTFEARLRRLEAPPTRPQASSLEGSSTLVNGGGGRPCGWSPAFAIAAKSVGWSSGLAQYGGGTAVPEVVCFVRFRAAWSPDGECVPPPPPPTRSQVQGALSGLEAVADCLGARRRGGGLRWSRSRLGVPGSGRFRQVSSGGPSNVSDARILALPGVQFWAQLASLPPPQVAQHVSPGPLAPSLAVPAAYQHPP